MKDSQEEHVGINPWILEQMKGEHKPGTLFNYTGPTTVAVLFTLGDIDIYYSDNAAIAFRAPKSNLVISKNEWGPDTERHMLELNSMDPEQRMPRAEFVELLRGLLAERGLTGELSRYGLAFEDEHGASAVKVADTINDLIESHHNREAVLRIGNEPCDPATLSFHPGLRIPLIVEAIQIEEVFEVNDSEGIHQGSPGDFLLRDSEGELRVVEEEIFKRSFLKWFFNPEPYNSWWRRVSGGRESCDRAVAEYPELCESLKTITMLLVEVCKNLTAP